MEGKISGLEDKVNVLDKSDEGTEKMKKCEWNIQDN
jgi:hypothetical protein